MAEADIVERKTGDATKNGIKIEPFEINYENY